MMKFNVCKFNVRRKIAGIRRFVWNGLLIWNQKTASLRSVFDAVFYTAAPPGRFAVGFIVSRSRISPDFRFRGQAENFFKIYRASGEATAFKLPKSTRSQERAGGRVAPQLSAGIGFV
jgi:hypothetical protein